MQECINRVVALEQMGKAANVLVFPNRLLGFRV
jgi:hypothetical protein